MRYVYVPMDGDFERLWFMHDARKHYLTPNAVNEIADHLIGPCLGQLAGFGVMECLTATAQDSTVEAAERIHETYLRGSHGATLAGWRAEQEKAKRLGLVPTSDENAPAKVKRALAKLKEWGVIAAACLVALLFAGQALAQQADPRVVAAKLDIDNTAVTYYAFDAKLYDAPLERITTSGSSTTVTAVSGTPFDAVDENDQLVIDNGTLCSATERVCVRTVTAKASGSSITVDTAVTLTVTAKFQYRKMRSGTAVTDGLFAMQRKMGTINITFAQANVTGGIDVNVQCGSRAADGTYRMKQVYPSLTPPTITASYTNFTSFGANSGLAVVIPDPWDVCRVGLKIGSADDGGDLTTNRELISIDVTFEEGQ